MPREARHGHPHRRRNVGIARIFNEIADLLEIQDANDFRVRAWGGCERRDFLNTWTRGRVQRGLEEKRW